MCMRVLVVDDRPALAPALCEGLRQSGMAVDVVDSGMEARDLLLQRNYGIVVFASRQLGEADLSTLKALRVSTNAPVIAVIAQDSVEDRVRCLDNGADDVLTHPVAIEEFLARIQLQAHRTRDAPRGGPLVLADLALDLPRKRAERSGLRLDLTRKEYALLMLLVSRSGEIVSRATLAEQIWDMPFDPTANVIDVAIRRLRRKLDDPYPVKLLHTVRGLGYVLEQR